MELCYDSWMATKDRFAGFNGREQVLLLAALNDAIVRAKDEDAPRDAEELTTLRDELGNSPWQPR